jgi:hypothetical protein
VCGNSILSTNSLASCLARIFSFPFKYKDSLFKEKKRKKNVSKQKETGRGQAETRERDVSP